VPDAPVPDTTGSEQAALLFAAHPSLGLLASVIGLLIIFGAFVVLIKR
ncbi:MAG: hypothetical protein JWL80_184, partial [Parcubacteria group bacterium]|nr:hypothetical protein [Parcubacteria group bacterium]